MHLGGSSKVLFRKSFHYYQSRGFRRLSEESSRWQLYLENNGRKYFHIKLL